MKFYFAPMEGITGHIYRRLYHEYFNNIDKFFSPFIPANEYARMRSRELRDILPENNEGITLVPQILTNRSVDFINTAKRIQLLGYDEINLNLGCPSGTVVGKGRGSGFLAFPDELDKFLDEIYTALPDMKISLKTRLGKEDVREFDRLYEIYKKYPVHELIVHPRTRAEFYNGLVHLKEYDRIVADAPAYPLCYNGNIFTVSDYKDMVSRYPDMDRVMIGRGILANPFLIDEINGCGKLNKDFIAEFTSRLYEAYREVMSCDRDAMFKLKEMWSYLSLSFADQKSVLKKVHKAKSSDEYKAAVRSIMLTEELK